MEVNLRKCRTYGISPDEYVLIILLQEKKLDIIKALFNKQKALDLRSNLIEKGFVISEENCIFKDTILSSKKVNKLLGIKHEAINFWQFYSLYPIKFAGRVFRAANPDSKQALKHEKKYLKAVTTLEDHEHAIKCLNAFVSVKRARGELAFLPMMETVLNNNSWEQWEVFINEEKEENWNNDTI
jgi:hypothetical protein